MRTYKGTCRTCSFSIAVEAKGDGADDSEALETQAIGNLIRDFRVCPSCKRQLNVAVDGREIHAGDPAADHPNSSITSLRA